MNRPVMSAAISVAMLPDVDALFLRFVPYSHPFGHRGMTHSLVFASAVGCVLAALFSRARWSGRHSFVLLAVFFTLVTASHGFFDAMTDGGLGVAFFWPFDNSRYFLPWRPIPVSPLSASALLSPRGLRVVRWEIGLFWTFAAAAALWDKRRMWRAIVAGVCLIAGLAMWMWALTEGA